MKEKPKILEEKTLPEMSLRFICFLLTHLPKISLLWLQEESEQNCSRYFPSLFTKLLLRLHFKDVKLFLPHKLQPSTESQREKGKCFFFFLEEKLSFLWPNFCVGAERVYSICKKESRSDSTGSFPVTFWLHSTCFTVVTIALLPRAAAQFHLWSSAEGRAEPVGVSPDFNKNHLQEEDRSRKQPQTDW